VPEVVELDTSQAGVAQRLPPSVADGVLVPWVVTLPGKQPPILADGAVSGDLFG
jgi:hypothetical protein